VIGAERLTGIYSEKSSVVYSGEDFDEEVETSSLQIAALGMGNGLNDSGGLGSSTIPRLGFDVFVIRGLSLGGSVMYLRTTGSEVRTLIPDRTNLSSDEDLPTRSTLLAAPRVGYALVFGKVVALWPRAGITYVQHRLRGEVEVADAGGYDTWTVERKTVVNTTEVSFEAVVVASLARNFAILIAPYADIQVGGNLKTEDDGEPRNVGNPDYGYLSFGLTAGMAAYF
jgi:hypothetical protein